MKFIKDRFENKWFSVNGMWTIEQGNGEYIISIKTKSGAWREICAFSNAGSKDAVEECKQYINSVCSTNQKA